MSCTKSVLFPHNTIETSSHNLFMLLKIKQHTDLRTLNVIECASQYLSHIDSNCCRPAEDKLMIERSLAYNKWFIRLPQSEQPIVFV